jgi:hypothetical protein
MILAASALEQFALLHPSQALPAGTTLKWFQKKYTN